MAEWLRGPNSNSGVSDQQSVGSIPSRDTCVLKQDTSPLLRPSDGTLSCRSNVLCNACKRTQCTYRKEKVCAPVFLVRLAANCATAPCEALHGAIRIRSHNSNIVPHLAGNTVCYSARSVTG